MTHAQEMDELSKRIAALSPEKRALFEQQKRLKLAAQTISKRQDNQNLPLAFAQERLWFLHQLEPDNAAYNIAIAWQFTGALNIAILERCFHTIVQRHESLRTAFVATATGKPRQVIIETLQLSLPVVDLRLLPDKIRADEVEKLAKLEACRCFDLTQAPLIRVTLIQLTAEKYVLLLTLHHLVADGWSRGIILRELATLYKAFTAKQPSPLTELPIQYADFAIWQQQWLQGDELTTQLTYWKQQLKNLPVLELPCDRSRTFVPTFRSATQSVSTSPELLQALKQLSREHGVTLFMLTLAAFNVLLHRYSRQDDIVIGSPIANRNWVETEPLIGFFVNTLVLRTNLAGNPSFRELLQRVRDVTAGAYKHQDLPFAKLVEELQPQRSLSHNPLFQVMFQLQNQAYQLQNAIAPELAIPGLKLEQKWIDTGVTKFDMTWHLAETAELLIVVEYNTDLFNSDTIARMLGHFQVLLSGIINNPDQRLSELPILTEIERQLVAAPTTAYPLAPVHQLFEAQVQRTPDNIAVKFAQQQLTYQELNTKANQLAHYLRTLGVKPDTLVAICMERSIELIIGILAILKAGGAYVPLDPQLPSARIAHMLEQVSVLICTSKVEVRADNSVTIICVDTDDAIALFPQTNLQNITDIQNLAYVIYTSGSTGKPKGTLLTHQGLTNYLHWATTAYHVTQGCGAPVQSSIGFDATITSIYAPLLAGKTVVLIPEAQELEILRDLLSTDSNFSLVKLTPAHLSILSQLLSQNQQQPGKATRAFIIGGEALLENHLDYWRKQLPSAKLINEYGPTEAVVGCCVYDASVQPDTSGIVPIGRAIANTQLYILDQYLQPVPIGIPGELYIGGVSLARGYLNKPDLTAEKFIPNPFADAKSSRLYKTGDLARYRIDGNIEYLGRLDHQVKIRGFRIEVEEIETVLTQHPQIQQATVIAHFDEFGKQRLVAYIVLHPATTNEVDHTSIRSFLQQQLPDYMIPSSFVTLPTLPLTSNGKVDRSWLISNVSSRVVTSNIQPRTANEAKLVKIWSEVLSVAVGIDDNFFELGGDSILAIQIIARANQAGLNLTLKQLFQHQTIAQLATVVRTAPQIAPPAEISGTVPLTPIQHWFFAQNLPNPHHYNQSILLEVLPLPPKLLAATLKQLALHHDAFRLRFVKDELNWQQYYEADATIPLSVVDLSGLSAAKQRLAIEQISARSQMCLNLSKSLGQCVLFKLGSASDRLLFIVHHLIIDGISWRILLDDFATYQLESGVLPVKSTTYQTWAKRLVDYAQTSAILAADLDYWLQDMPHFEPLPIDTQAPNTVASTEQVNISLDAAQTRTLLDAPKYHVQINDVLITALVQSFTQWTKLPSLRVDLEKHGREDLFADVDLSRTLGWFTSVFPVQLTLGDRHPTTALKSIKEQLRQIPHNGISYGLLRYLSNDENVRSRLQQLPQAEVKFNYLGQLDHVPNAVVLGLATESVTNLRSTLGERCYLLEINAWIAQGKFQSSWNYSQNIHQAKTIERLAQTFIAAVANIIAHQTTPAAGYTPSDFAAAKLTQKQLDQFITKIKKPGTR